MRRDDMEHNFKVGGKVKIFKKISRWKTGSGHWNRWIPEMDCNIGKIVTITTIEKDWQFYIEEDEFAYPFECTEKVIDPYKLYKRRDDMENVEFYQIVSLVRFTEKKGMGEISLNNLTLSINEALKDYSISQTSVKDVLTQAVEMGFFFIKQTRDGDMYCLTQEGFDLYCSTHDLFKEED